MNNAIHLDRVCKSLGNRQILRDISFDVPRGSIFGFLGPNGAGKTTTIRIILGLFKADSGKAEILGRPAEEDTSRRDVGFVLESDGLYDNISGRDNLTFYSRLYGLPPDKSAARINEVLRMVGLYDRAGDKVSDYSRGMRQKLAIARAMVHDAALLILDEPTAGIDPTGQVEVREIVLDLARRGKTIFFSSHNLDEVQRICDHVCLVDRGEIRLLGTLDELRRNKERQELDIVVLHKDIDETLVAAVCKELEALPFAESCRYENGHFLLGISRTPDLGRIIAVLSEHSIETEEIRREKASLEEIYTTAMQETGQ